MAIFFRKNGAKWGKMGTCTGKMGENGGKNGKITREKRGNALGKTCFQALLQGKVVCGMLSLAALHSIHVLVVAPFTGKHINFSQFSEIFPQLFRRPLIAIPLPPALSYGVRPNTSLAVLFLELQCFLGHFPIFPAVFPFFLMVHHFSGKFSGKLIFKTNGKF